MVGGGRRLIREALPTVVVAQLLVLDGRHPGRQRQAAHLGAHEPVDLLVEQYLPFIAEAFTQDAQFLGNHPSYFLSVAEQFLGLYGFLYCSQLCLNLNGWTAGPAAKPLHFILDTEKASAERTEVRNSYANLKQSAADLFPILSILEYLNLPTEKGGPKYPLWHYYSLYESASPVEQESYDRELGEARA